jgi:hypothetical protein
MFKEARLIFTRIQIFLIPIAQKEHEDTPKSFR